MPARGDSAASTFERIRWVATAAALTASAVQARRRVRRIAVLPRGVSGPAGDQGVLVSADGTGGKDTVLRGTVTHARNHGLDAVDLVPGDLPMERAFALFRSTDPAAYRAATKAPLGGCQAVWMSTPLAERLGLEPQEGLDRGDLMLVGEQVHKSGGGNADLVLAPGLEATQSSPRDTFRQLNTAMPFSAPATLAAQAIGCGVLAHGAWRAWRTGSLAGLVPLAAYSAQGLVAFAGTSLTPRDLWRRSAMRLPHRLVDIVATSAVVLEGDPREKQAHEEQRPVYEALLADGTERFFRPRRSDCPMCESADISPVVHVGDLRLFKPGTFTLERCGSCDHIFQNPMLSEEGLAFYYRDAYDGLSERSIEVLFGSSSAGERDRRRAERIAAHTTPERWLDIGGSHGHLCHEARRVLPETEFHALDMSESIEEAQRRGWVDRAYRGQVHEHAAELAEQFDVVSMHHYLEHTVDPRAELQTVASFLKPGGYLLIEVPNGHSPMAGLWRSMWFHWVAPQHLHFLPQENLEAELADLGFEIVERQGHEAHIVGVDFVASLFNVVNQLVPPVRWPWLPRPTRFARVRRAAVVTASSPLFVVAAVLDLLNLGFVRATGKGNAYGLVARRTDDAPAGVEPLVTTAGEVYRQDA